MGENLEITSKDYLSLFNALTMTSEFMIALYGSFAQAESESISKNVSWGKEKAYREGKVAFQYKHLLGYKKGDDGKPEIVPDEAETVRMIFKMYLDGYTLLNIAQSLMKQNRLTALGKNVWTKGEVQRILKNEKYVGDALLQKTFTVDCITHKVMKNNGERPMYLVTDHHDPIVDRDRNKFCQNMLWIVQMRSTISFNRKKNIVDLWCILTMILPSAKKFSRLSHRLRKLTVNSWECLNAKLLRN